MIKQKEVTIQDPAASGLSSRIVTISNTGLMPVYMTRVKDKETGVDIDNIIRIKLEIDINNNAGKPVKALIIQRIDEFTRQSTVMNDIEIDIDALAEVRSQPSERLMWSALNNLINHNLIPDCTEILSDAIEELLMYRAREEQKAK